MSKERKLAVCIGTLLCLGNSLNSMAMDRDWSPGTKDTIKKHYVNKNESNVNSIFNSMKILNAEHGIKLYSYDGKQYILKKNNKGGSYAKNEEYIYVIPAYDIISSPGKIIFGWNIQSPVTKYGGVV